MLFLKGLWSRFQLYIAGGLLATCILVSIALAFTTQKLKTVEVMRDRDKIVFQEKIREIEKVQVEYKLKAVQAKAKTEKADAKRKVEADEYAAALKSKYNDLLVRYASEQNRSKVSGSNMPRSSGAAQSVDRSGASSVVPKTTEVMVPYEDLDICADNTARLEAGRKWAQEQGKIIVEAEKGK